MRLIEPPAAFRVAGVEPLASDHREKHAALGQARLDRFDEVLTRLEGVNVAEDPITAEPVLERFVEPSRVSRRIVAPVTDERRRHGSSDFT